MCFLRRSVSGAAGLALLAAATLDGVPENLVLGVALGEGSGGIALLAAIFVADFPEALVGSASMREQGRSQAFILGTWTVCALLLVFAVDSVPDHCRERRTRRSRYRWLLPRGPSSRHSPTR